MKREKLLSDVLLVGYDDNSSEGDIPVLIIGRKVGNITDIVKAVKGVEASAIYEMLTKGDKFDNLLSANLYTVDEDLKKIKQILKLED